ncbi:DUF934 domain-containing protein [Microbulbifer thermotolerans]|uniref:DUF934 domain-containing protein n=1 Tax=Microbulbifer thermotolerans TaxID=252514 RepID=A0A143HL88_MICTH|nr:DUF934 domain-containing protein [Microbulbifer thermotolerans]AMX02453.1 oxidoreductase [Microbulbifer thermotolerans]MCX2779303.1 DUF934 domain-containing protein [Microbulbifer thermotolerans]MCX2795078.1 DUF934 domain-containing protein [Microbulbifer thermotolerans]MCX2803186.1 DUF934 domain-containing protein [Microbulbifer thermotolerans]MCX2806539.1 DUF934 domain-containing protein [Microbulbifer thermotolerans]
MPTPNKQPANPAELIIDEAIAENQWRLLPQSEEGSEISAETLAPGKVILPFSIWSALKGSLTERASEIGVWLDSDESADLIGTDATTLPLIAVNFPAFTDGRGFTTGRLLRERYGFQGELRAVGAFIRDQLTYLRRCGFNAFAYEGEQPLKKLLDSMYDFSESYQTSVDQPLPMFRRRSL